MILSVSSKGKYDATGNRALSLEDTQRGRYSLGPDELLTLNGCNLQKSNRGPARCSFGKAEYCDHLFCDCMRCGLKPIDDRATSDSFCNHALRSNGEIANASRACDGDYQSCASECPSHSDEFSYYAH